MSAASSTSTPNTQTSGTDPTPTNLASAIGDSVNTLIEEAKFVGVGSVPDVCVFGVLVELLVLE